MDNLIQSGFFSTFLAWTRAHHLPGLSSQRQQTAARRFAASTIRSLALALVEVSLLLAWALVVGSAFLDLDPMRVPAGHEYLSAIQSHHLWTRVRECGACAFWNGSTRGGSPAFADIYGSMLHPLVIVTTLVWGVLNGSKIALMAALFLSGLAQWLLARVLGLGRAARLWSAGLAVAGGIWQPAWSWACLGSCSRRRLAHWFCRPCCCLPAPATAQAAAGRRCCWASPWLRPC